MNFDPMYNPGLMMVKMYNSTGGGLAILLGGLAILLTEMLNAEKLTTWKSINISKDSRDGAGRGKRYYDGIKDCQPFFGNFIKSKGLPTFRVIVWIQLCCSSSYHHHHPSGFHVTYSDLGYSWENMNKNFGKWLGRRLGGVIVFPRRLWDRFWWN